MPTKLGLDLEMELYRRIIMETFALNNIFHLIELLSCFIFTLFVIGFSMEFLIRIYYKFFGNKRYLVYHPNQERIFILDKSAFHGIATPSHFKVNNIGIRGSEISNEQTYRILAMGSSTSVCLLNDQGKAWPCIVEKLLNNLNKEKVWVGNVARAGMCSRDHVMYFKRLLPQLPKIDTVIIEIGYTDFSRRLQENSTYNQHALEDYVAFEQNAIWGAFYKTPYFPKKYEFKFGHYGRLALGKLYLEMKSWYKNISKSYDSSGNYMIKLRNARKMAKEVLDDLPDLSSAIAEYKNNLASITSLARQQKIRLVFITDPYLWKTSMSEAERAMLFAGAIESYKSGRYYSTDALLKGIALYHETLISFCAENNLDCIDLAKAMPSTLDNFSDDIHLTDNGCAFVAQYIADYLTTKPPFATNKT